MEKEVLIDTHSLYWFMENPKKLPKSAKRYFDLTDKIPCVSYATLWEIQIKNNLGALPLSKPYKRFLETIEINGLFILLPTLDDLVAYESLPYFHDHRDPFDRFIIAQARARNLPVLTADAQFERYSIPIIW